MASDELFTREEVLGGLPARRARGLLFQIEIATAQASAHTGRLAALTGSTENEKGFSAGNDIASGEAGGAGNDDWLRVFGQSRGATHRPTIRQIERYAQKWAYVAPATARLRAAVAHLMGEKYRFTYAAIPGIRAALALDTEEVGQAYQAMYGRPLNTVFAPELTLAEKIHWRIAAVGKRLDALPPFWMAFSYMLMGNCPGAILALPIAVAGIGPLAGLVFLLTVGAVNLLTTACMAEGLKASGSIQYRNMYLGRLTASYLGPAGSRLVYGTSVLQAFLTLVAGYVAFSFNLSHSVGLSPGLWIIVFTAILIYRLWKGERGSSITADFVLGGACIGLATLICILALPHVHIASLGAIQADFWSKKKLNEALLAGVFGGLLVCYPGQSVIPQCAKLTLPRDGSGRALIRGSLAGILAAMLFHCFLLLSIMGAVSSTNLLQEQETALRPLGALLGPVVLVLGAITVCLFIGLDGAGASDILFALIRERLPSISHSVGALFHHQGRLLFHRHSDFGETPRLGLVYLGLVKGGHPRLRVDILSGTTVHRAEVILEDRWDVQSLYAQFPELQKHGYRLELELLEADASMARFLIATQLRTSYEEGRENAGLNMVTALNISEEDRGLLRWLMVQGEADTSEAAAEQHVEESVAAARFARLEQQRMVQRVGPEGSGRYRPRWTKRRRSRLPDAIWKSLEDTAPETAAVPTEIKPSRWKVLLDRAQEAAMSEMGRFVLSAAPVVIAAIVSLWLLMFKQVSFSGILEVSGILTVILSSGIFPVLLLASCRRKGMGSSTGFWRFLGSPPALTTLYIVFVCLLIAQGSLFGRVLWERIAALAVAGIVIYSTLIMKRSGAFRSRQVVELREDLREGGSSEFRIVADGMPTPARVRLEYAAETRTVEAADGEVPAFALLRRVRFELPETTAREIKIWTHRVTPAGDSETLPALLEMETESGSRHFDLGLQGGQIVAPRPRGVCTVQLILESIAIDKLPC